MPGRGSVREFQLGGENSSYHWGLVNVFNEGLGGAEAGEVVSQKVVRNKSILFNLAFGSWRKGKRIGLCLPGGRT